MTLLSLLDRATHASPDHAAVRCRERSLSYAQLQAQVNRLANTLLRLGVRKGDRVAFCMAKDLESIVALYGIMKAGAAYVPLDPLAPPSRSAQVCKDASVRVLITKAANLARTGAAFNGVPLQGIIGVEGFKGFSGSVVSWLEVEAESEACGESPVPGDYDLAYVLYTSGSTGVPKGISHTHESCIAFVEWAVQEFEVSGLDRLANHAPFHFDLSTFDVFAAAAAAATLVIVPETDSRFPAQVARLIESAGITVWYSVPFALIQLLERGSLHEKDFSALRLVLFAGEVFPTPSLRQLMMRLPHARFANLYGPTETNVCTYYRLDAPPEAADLPIPIGVACPFAQLCVVDDADQVVTPGVAGELLVRGESLMQGYWNRPDLDERAFVHVPHEGDGRFYRTGDLVRERPDGNYDFLGRKDRQVKIRGYRVELDEVEHALAAHPRVHEVAVYTWQIGNGVVQIEAAIVPASGTEVDGFVIRSYLAERLPPYAVPVNIHIVEQMPRTSTGKIDRKALEARHSTPAAGR